MIRIALAFLLILFAAAAMPAEQYAWGDYIMTGSGGKVRVAHPRYGEWEGYINGPRPAPDNLTRHSLQFEFEADNYFIDENKGHFAVAVVADTGPKHLIGRGVTIGNVSGYGKRKGGCTQSLPGNRVTIESFWSGGNCVWGDVSSSVRLVDHERYRLTIVAQRSAAGEPGRVFGYRLEQRTGLLWREVGAATIFDSSVVPAGHAGWFLLEVFSTHDWTMRVFNVVETLE